MKKLLSFALCAAMLLSLAACSSNESGKTDADASDVSAVPEESSIPEKSEPTATVLESSGDLGDYYVEIGDFEIGKDYDGNPAIIVHYTFTNNGEEAANAMFSVIEQAYQNGVQLETAIIMDGSVNSEDKMKDLKTGASIDVASAFVLTSETAPVEFEISEFISLDDEKIGEICEISENGETVLPTAPVGNVTDEIGDYTVSVVSYEMKEDYEGKTAVVITLGFTNNSDDTVNFMGEIDCSAFQDGVELETAIMTDGTGAGDSQLLNIRPGAGIPVYVAYLTTSETSPIELEITEFLSFGSDKIETTINLV